MSDALPRDDPFGFGWPAVISVVRIALIPAIVALIVTVYSGLEYFPTTRHRVAAS